MIEKGSEIISVVGGPASGKSNYIVALIHQLLKYQSKLGLSKELGIAEIVSAGLAGKNDLVKVLGNGEIKAAVTVTAHGFSKSAIAKIEAAGGKAVVIE